MSNSPVLELQALSASSDADVQEVLSKAKMISVKLGLTDITQWLDCEIYGYKIAKDTLPEYRIIKGLPIIAYNSNGSIPVIVTDIDDQKIYDFISSAYIYDSIASILPLSNQKGFLDLMLSKNQAARLNKLMPKTKEFNLIWEVNHNVMIGIISTVKARILDWSLALEAKGILGENLQFSATEKEIAQKTVNNTNIFNGSIHNTGIIGSGNSDFSQENMIVEVNNFSSLENELKKYGISAEDLKDLKLALDETPAETLSKNNLGTKIGGWVGNMVGKACSGVLKLPGDVAAQLITAAICAYLGIGN